MPPSTSLQWKQSVERLQMTEQEYWRILMQMVEAMEPTISNETRLYRAKKLLDPWFGPKMVGGTITRIDPITRMEGFGQTVAPLSKGSPEYLMQLHELMGTWDGLELAYDVKYRKAVKLLTKVSIKSGYWTSGQGNIDRHTV